MKRILNNKRLFQIFKKGRANCSSFFCCLILNCGIIRNRTYLQIRLIFIKKVLTMPNPAQRGPTSPESFSLKKLPFWQFFDMVKI